MDVPEVQFVESAGGVTIAYQTWGKGKANIVGVPVTPLTLDVVWASSRVRRLQEYLAVLGRVMTMDLRGYGSSDSVPLDQLRIYDDWVADILTVMDACDMDRAVFFTDSFASHIALNVAAKAPDRVSGLWLANGLLRTDAEVAAGAVELVEGSWGTGVASAGARPPGMFDQATFARWERMSAPRNVATELIRRQLAFDATEVAGAVRAPTVVAYTGDMTYVSIEQSRELADAIPGAEFVDFSDAAEFYLPVEARAVEAFEHFVAGRTVDRSQQLLASVVFTDVVESTRQAAERGDTRWRVILDDLDGVAHEAADRHGGEVVKDTGDGHLVIVDTPIAAIEVARSLTEGARRLGIDVRSGIHTGTVMRRGADVSGIAVHTAARVMDHAGAGAVLVSRTVADLVAGSGIEFTDRGTHELKGVPGEWQLFEVTG